MKEINRDSLKRAIEQLPEHQPEDHLWQSLEEELGVGEEQKRETLLAAIRRLPVYQTPAYIWQRIEGELPAQRRTLYRWSMRAAAAVIIGAIGFSLWLRQPVSKNKERAAIILDPALRSYHPSDEIFVSS
ncbi:MAG: hypothetical protein AAF206_25330, partial [Bacteroidota bacterium]